MNGSPSVKVALFIRNGGSESLCRWFYVTGIYTYLKNYEPYELVHFSGNTYITRTHDSLKMSNGKWMWWSQRTGGRSVLDYLIKVRGYSFKFGKDITIRLEGWERGLKLKRNFGENYSLEAIRVRILEENELPIEKSSINIYQTGECIVLGGFIKTVYHFKRDEVTLPLSHWYCRNSWK